MFGECLCVHIQWSDRRRLQCGRAELTSPACAGALFSSLCSIRHTHKDKHTNTRRFPSHPAACLSAKWVLTARLHPRPHNNLAYTHIHSSPLSRPSCYTHKHTYPGGLCVFVFLWLQGKWEPVRSDCDAYEYLWVFACSLWNVCEDRLWPFCCCMCVSAVESGCTIAELFPVFNADFYILDFWHSWMLHDCPQHIKPFLEICKVNTIMRCWNIKRKAVLHLFTLPFKGMTLILQNGKPSVHGEQAFERLPTRTPETTSLCPAWSLRHV